MSPGLKLKYIGVLLGITALLSFQNCSQPVEDSSSNSSLEELTPFAYSATPDTIAHMSCSGLADSGPDRRAYFSFRVGAYNPLTGGLKVTDSFRDAMKYYSIDQRARVFGISAKNSNTNLSVSIRSTSNYQSIWKEGETRAGEELDAMLPDLDSAQIASPLAALQPNEMRNYFPGSQDKRLMEGSLRYYHFENTMVDTRAALDRRDAIMAIGYSDTTDSQDTKLRIPDGNPNDAITPPTNRAYGTGYFLHFSLPYGYTGGETRVISPNGGIEEIDLTTNTSKPSAWDCSAAYQFMVVRPEDACTDDSLPCPAGKTVRCKPTVDPNPTNATDLAALIAIRRVLRVEDWFVDLARRCIMPKRTGDYCYGPMNGRTIQYGQQTCTNSNTTMCPHFVSVCIKH